ncbi:MAG: hypothetical protein JWL58_2234 [Streptosporangiaceae bacterium]|nr:hypothetical protein [Streptosporangiaceae bacterium]
MSSGVEAEIALDAAVVLSLGMNRALGAAAGAAGRGAEALAALTEARADARAAALEEARDYHRVLLEVIDRNARIAVLTDARERHGAEITLPDPLMPTGQPISELTDWSEAAGIALDTAERQMSEQIAASVAARVFDLPAAGLVTGAQATGRQAAGAEAVLPAERPEARAAAEETLARVVARLLPDATAAEISSVGEAAAQLATARTAGEVEGLLTEVRIRVQAANQRTAERRAEAARLAAEEEAAAQAEDERRYLLDSVTAAFGELGYEVDQGFETLTAQDGTVTLTRDGWSQHAVRMKVEHAEHSAGPSSHATLRAALVRTQAPRNEEERRIDVEREQEWCATFEAARARMAGSGIHSDVRWRLDPGEQQLPVAPEARHTRGRAKPQAREQRQERGH